MKSLKQIILEATNTIKFRPVELSTVQKYLDVASKQLSPEAKQILNWIIDNKRDSGDVKKLVDGSLHIPGEKELLKNIDTLKKYKMLGELPYYQSEESTQLILDKKRAVDEIIMDFVTEKGRQFIAKKYQNLVYKIAHSYKYKSNLDFNDLVSAGYIGLVMAMNKYGDGKIYKELQEIKNKVKEQENGLEMELSKKEEEEIEKEADMTERERDDKDLISFKNFAIQQIRFYILEDIKHLSRTVRVATSAQRKEYVETGRNTKDNSVSMDAPVSRDAEGNTKTLLDKISDEVQDDGASAEHEGVFKTLMNIIKKRFTQRDKEGKTSARHYDIICDLFGLDGHKEMKAKEVADKYGIANSNVTRIKKEVIKFVQEDPEAREAAQEFLSYVSEAKKRKREKLVNEARRVFKINRD